MCYLLKWLTGGNWDSLSPYLGWITTRNMGIYRKEEFREGEDRMGGTV
jgi:hypothetical protein